MRFIVLFLALTFCFAIPAQAQTVTTPRTEVTLTTDLATVTPSRPFWALFHVKLKDGWHTYWKNPGDSGTIPQLKWTLPAGFTTGDIQYQSPERLPVGPLMDYGYNNDAYYLIPIKPPELVNNNATIIIMLKAQWLVCKDTCIPEKGEFSVMLPVTPEHTEPKPTEHAQLIDDLVKKLPTPIAEPAKFAIEGDKVRFDVKIPKTLETSPSSVSFFPLTDGVILNNAEQQVNIAGDTLSFSIPKGEGSNVEKWEGVTSIYGPGDYRKDYAVTLEKGDVAAAPATAKAGIVAATSETLTLQSAIVLALLGGLILNLMPCVLPILSLKVLSVAKKAKSHKSEVRKQALAYTFGVVLSFVLLAGLLLALQKLAGESLGWGFQMQSPVFVSLLSILMLLVGLNLSGAFELPVLFGNTGSEAASKDNTLGSFLTGVLAVMVATPCTAPFMAPAIGFALTQPPAIVVQVFAALGVGLASPFLLLSVFPGLASLMPRPGAWMLTFKQFLAFPIYLTVVWLLWVLAAQAGPDGVAVAMLGMVSAGFCVFLLQRNSVLARMFGFALVILTATAVSHYIRILPPPTAPTATQASNVFSTERIAELRKAGIPVFVDATAQWCITCKVNETVVLSRPEIKKAFEDKKVVTLIADWTHGDMEITKYLQSFDRSGVPLYVYYPPNGEPKLLPQILTNAIVLEAIGAPHE